MKNRNVRPLSVNAITTQVIGLAMEVHTALGPGLLESAYETCLAYELVAAGLSVERQKPITIRYKQLVVPSAYRIDLLIEDSVAIEIKAVHQFDAVHTAQLLSYLRLIDRYVGLLINFNVTSLKHGIKRVINGFHD